MGDQPKTCYEAGARADATDSHRLLGCGQARGPHQLLLIGLQAVMGGGSTTRLVLEILGSPYGRFFDRQVQHGSDMTRWSPSSSWVSSGTAPQRRCPITRFDTRWRSAPVSGRFRAAPESRCRNAAWAVEAANLKHDARQSTSRAPAHGSDKPARKRGAPSAPRGMEIRMRVAVAAAAVIMLVALSGCGSSGGGSGLPTPTRSFAPTTSPTARPSRSAPPTPSRTQEASTTPASIAGTSLSAPPTKPGSKTPAAPSTVAATTVTVSAIATPVTTVAKASQAVTAASSSFRSHRVPEDRGDGEGRGDGGDR